MEPLPKMEKYFFDFHIHPLIKPFGHACKRLLKHYQQLKPEYFNIDWLSENHPGILEDFFDPRSKASLWNDKRPCRFFNKLFGELAFAKYSQSNLTAAKAGNSRVVSISLYPIEKEFLTKSADQKILGLPLFKNIVTGISSARIKYIQGPNYRYFDDTVAQYEYLKTSAELSIPSGQKLILAGSYSEIEAALKAHPDAIIGFLSIEGANVFYPTKEIRKEDINQVLANIETVKNWEHPPLMISPAHHFYNGFVSHEASLVKMVRCLGNIDQSKGCNEELSAIPGFQYYTKEGLQVIDKLLDSSSGKRILIDLKHTDYRGRKEYYEFIEENYNNEVPVVFSHAAIGVETPEEWFNTWTINLNHDDIRAVWRTKGLIGLELDQRLLGFDRYVKYCRKNNIKVRKTDSAFNAALVWNAARFIAQQCAHFFREEAEPPGTNAWRCISLGSDFDGLINPINGFPTLRYYQRLRAELIKYATGFLNEPKDLLHQYSPDNAEELVDGLMRTNGMEFLKKNF
jgi:hypothetical protein